MRTNNALKVSAMANAVLLDNVQHHDLKVIGGHGPHFGDAINEVPVFATEFAELQREYPIYFRQDGKGGFQAFALLGLDKNENLFLDGDTWNARYIPAMQQRGPLMIGMRPAQDGDDAAADPVIMVDLDHPRLSRSEGQSLFLPHGGHAPQLERHARSLRAIHQGVDVNRAMFAAFLEARLMAPVEMTITLDDTTRYNLPELFSISQEALTALDGATLERLNKQGFLALAFLVLASVGNINRIIEMKKRRRAGQ